MLKALILILEVPILFLVPLVNDIPFFGKYTEALILDFEALLEYLEEGIRRNRFCGCPGLISHRAPALWRVFYPWHHRALLRRRITLV